MTVSPTARLDRAVVRPNRTPPRPRLGLLMLRMRLDHHAAPGAHQFADAAADHGVGVCGCVRVGLGVCGCGVWCAGLQDRRRVHRHTGCAPPHRQRHLRTALPGPNHTTAPPHLPVDRPPNHATVP